jgi:hypothetical protein
MTLEWEFHPAGNGQRSVCGGYWIGIGLGGEWQTWKLAPGGPWFAPLASGLESEGAAKSAAEEDRAK